MVGLSSLSITKLSAIFDKVDVKGIGRSSFPRSWTIEILGKGTTSSSFHNWGTLQLGKEVLIIFAIANESMSEKVFKTLYGI
jgi:hypothetical protein